MESKIKTEDSEVFLKKGFVQINITALVYHPGTEEEKTRHEHLGDFAEAQPIMYDIMVPVGRELTEAEMLALPDKMTAEVVSVLQEISRFVRTHEPDPKKLMQLRADKSIKAAPKIDLLDSTGLKIPSKH